jgi:ferric-dicitrate binding protein FerR (iron transport regulator)
MDVKVLGTVFNVKAYPTDKLTETSLIKGSVEIMLHNKAAEKILLRPNQKIILPNHKDDNTATIAVKNAPKTNVEDFKITGLTYSKVDSTLTEVSWTENRLVFNESRLDEVAAELERWYNITIRFNDEQVKQYRFTAFFDQKNIVQVLDALQLSRRFEYKIAENNNIIISK